MPSGQARADLRELVIAWANDAASLLPTYILELGADRSGAKSGCLCPGCGNPLIAVNNAKAAFLVRPHFRHHPGASAQDCSIIAARMAILRTMQDLGWIDLPARTRKGSVIGIDGQVYWGHSERPPERVRIRTIEFSDSAPAILHLEGGRKVSVVLRGTSTPDQSSMDLGAVIFIEVDDPSVALMDPLQLRERLTLKGGACWHHHWDDAEMLDEATSQARDIAIEHLALAPDDLDLPSDMPAELKTETVLHYAVKHILKEAGELRTPHEDVYVKAFSQKKRYDRTWVLPAQHLTLTNVEMEKRLGLTRPDLVCEAVDKSDGPSYPALCIEVTVSNPIGEERRQRIRSEGLPALEIDLSRLPGQVTKTKLKQLVVLETSMKSWLFHPLLSAKWQELDSEVRRLRDEEDQAIEEEEAEIRRIQEIPLRLVAERYLDKAYAYFQLLQHAQDHWSQPPSAEAIALANARQELSEEARLLAIKGYPGADDEDFLDARGILEALLSLRHDRGLCRDLNTGFQVLNALMAGGQGVRNEFSPLHLAAARTFEVPMNLEQKAVFEQWRSAVKDRIGTIKDCYVRKETHDALLAILFPELIDALVRTTSRHFSSIYRRGQEALRVPASKPSAADAKAMPQISASSSEWLRNSDYLQGSELEAWVRKYPEQAKILGIRFDVRKK